MDRLQVASEWGNNPATWQAIASIIGALGIVAVFISTILAWHSLRETRAQRQANEKEMAARMRPWMGLFGFTFEPAGPPSAAKDDLIRLDLRNFGALPAQEAKLTLQLRPINPSPASPDNAIQRKEKGEKTLLPGERGNYTIDVGNYPQFIEWRKARLDVSVQGEMNYNLNTAQFRTEFEAQIWFSHNSDKSDAQVKINWRNTRAV